MHRPHADILRHLTFRSSSIPGGSYEPMPEHSSPLALQALVNAATLPVMVALEIDEAAEVADEAVVEAAKGVAEFVTAEVGEAERAVEEIITDVLFPVATVAKKGREDGNG